MSKYQPGQHVTCNGNPEGVVIGPYAAGMYEVRIWSGTRHVGDVCVSESDLDLENETEPGCTCDHPVSGPVPNYCTVHDGDYSDWLVFNNID